MTEPDPKPKDGHVETRTAGYNDQLATPKTPSEREEWDRARHAGALEYYQKQNERPGMTGEVARRNQYCPACKGVVDWREERCPHCKAEIPVERRDYYNFSDFEPPVDRNDLLPMLTAALILFILLAAVLYGAIWALTWMLNRFD